MGVGGGETVRDREGVALAVGVGVGGGETVRLRVGVGGSVRVRVADIVVVRVTVAVRLTLVDGVPCVAESEPLGPLSEMVGRDSDTVSVTTGDRVARKVIDPGLGEADRDAVGFERLTLRVGVDVAVGVGGGVRETVMEIVNVAVRAGRIRKADGPATRTRGVRVEGSDPDLRE